jgi:hypothetical protein
VAESGGRAGGRATPPCGGLVGVGAAAPGVDVRIVGCGGGVSELLRL